MCLTLYAWPMITFGLFLCTIACLFSLPFVGIEILVVGLVFGLFALMMELHEWTAGSERGVLIGELVLALMVLALSVVGARSSLYVRLSWSS